MDWLPAIIFLQALLNKLFVNTPGVVIAPASTTCFLKACNFFINFTE
jgi:hypothetical protein